MIRLIATDMDGTLLNSQKEFDDEFFDVLSKVIDQNIYFVVASGNQFHHLYNQFKPFSDSLYFISENGSYITKGKKEMASFLMKKEDVKIVNGILQKYPELMTVMGGKEKSYIYEQYRCYQEEIERHYDEYAFVKGLDDIHEGIFKFSIHDPKHHVERYVDLIKEELPSYLHIMTSGNEWMDIQHEMIHKGFGMHFLIDSLGVSRDECAAFGDQMNDYELLKSVKYSYAMANAVLPIKEIAYETIQSNDEAGVTHKIKEIIGGS